MKKNYFILMLLFSVCKNLSGQATCQPEPGLTCDLAPVICLLADLNGYCCNNINVSNPTGCSPLCPSGGAPHNTSWWAFTGIKGTAEIKITFSNCSVNGTGVQMGIWADCICSNSVVCNPACNGPGTYTLSGTFIPTQTYYFFVDGCSGDVCDFCLFVTGEQSDIKNIVLSNIEGPSEICVSQCPRKYKLTSNQTTEPTYQWWIGTDTFFYQTNEISIDLVKLGTFQLCAQAYVGNPTSHQYCALSEVKCIDIKVLPPVKLHGGTTELCAEDLPYIWRGHRIMTSGEYTFSFISRIDCCMYDSVRTFIVNVDPNSRVAYFIGCDESEIFTDSISGLSFNGCQRDRYLNLGIPSNYLPCDSAMVVQAVVLDYNLAFRPFCFENSVHIEVLNSSLPTECEHPELSLATSYRWYARDDSLAMTLDTGKVLRIFTPGHYCVEMTVHANFGTINKTCTFVQCDEFTDPNLFTYAICPIGTKGAIEGQTYTYVLDTLPPGVILKHLWTVQGGTILTAGNGINSPEIKVRWNLGINNGKVCYGYETECGTSLLCCFGVSIVTSIEINDLNDNQIRVYPNPLNLGDELLIESFEKWNRATIFDQLGRIILQTPGSNCNVNPCKIPINKGIAAGLYWLRLEFEEQQFIKPFILLDH